MNDFAKTYEHCSREELAQNLLDCCRDPDLPLLGYLLTETQLKHSESSYLNYVLNFSCKYGHVEVVKYLLTSPELIVHAETKDGTGFTWAVFENHTQLISYLIFEYGIELSKPIKDYLDRYRHDDVLEMFRVREEKMTLNENIVETPKSVRKIKI